MCMWDGWSGKAGLAGLAFLQLFGGKYVKMDGVRLVRYIVGLIGSPRGWLLGFSQLRRVLLCVPYHPTLLVLDLYQLDQRSNNHSRKPPLQMRTTKYIQIMDA